MLWTIFAGFFGIVVTDPNNSKSKGGKFLLMIFLFCGRGFFFAYQAFLTSSLAFPNEFLAFTSPQEILDTNYRYIIVLDKVMRIIDYTVTKFLARLGVKRSWPGGGDSLSKALTPTM